MAVLIPLAERRGRDSRVEEDELTAMKQKKEQTKTGSRGPISVFLG